MYERTIFIVLAFSSWYWTDSVPSKPGKNFQISSLGTTVGHCDQAKEPPQFRPLSREGLYSNIFTCQIIRHIVYNLVDDSQGSLLQRLKFFIDSPIAC